MKFWDASALVPLVIAEASSEWAYSLLQEDQSMLVWCLTTTEITSALYRLVRAGPLTHPHVQSAKAQLKKLQKAWHEIVHFEVVRERAERLLATHPLRAADALQLSAALIAFQEQPEGKHFVCLDKRLSLAASLEGFQVFSVTTGG